MFPGVLLRCRVVRLPLGRLVAIHLLQMTKGEALTDDKRRERHSKFNAPAGIPCSACIRFLSAPAVMLLPSSTSSSRLVGPETRMVLISWWYRLLNFLASASNFFPSRIKSEAEESSSTIAGGSRNDDLFIFLSRKLVASNMHSRLAREKMQVSS